VISGKGRNLPPHALGLVTHPFAKVLMLLGGASRQEQDKQECQEASFLALSLAGYFVVIQIAEGLGRGPHGQCLVRR
jgi:hypothetical protein